MKCVMRVIAFMGPEIKPFATQCQAQIVGMLVVSPKRSMLGSALGSRGDGHPCLGCLSCAEHTDVSSTRSLLHGPAMRFWLRCSKHRPLGAGRAGMCEPPPLCW